MNEELLERIKYLHDAIENEESNYRTSISNDSSYDTLKSIRTQINELKSELHDLELSLLALGR